MRFDAARCPAARRAAFISLLFSALPVAMLADVTTRTASTHSVTTSEMTTRIEQAMNDYQQGLQFADIDSGTPDWPEAARCFRKAAEAGYSPAQYELGRLYADGLGVEHDLKQAALWYRKAADQGDAEAQNNLGALYAKGQGVRRSDSQAVRWYRLAAAQNDPEATSNLGMMYFRGRGVTRDPTQAFVLLLRSAQMGYATAQNNLALLYANGEGVGRDFVWAYAWLELASKQVSGAERLRDEVGKQMTPEQIARAKTLAAQEAAEIAESQRTARQGLGRPESRVRRKAED
jgi:hypothetical protein